MAQRYPQVYAFYSQTTDDTTQHVLAPPVPDNKKVEGDKIAKCNRDLSGRMEELFIILCFAAKIVTWDRIRTYSGWETGQRRSPMR